MDNLSPKNYEAEFFNLVEEGAYLYYITLDKYDKVNLEIELSTATKNFIDEIHYKCSSLASIDRVFYLNRIFNRLTNEVDYELPNFSESELLESTKDLCDRSKELTKKWELYFNNLDVLNETERLINVVKTLLKLETPLYFNSQKINIDILLNSLIVEEYKPGKNFIDSELRIHFTNLLTSVCL
jgi:hypothetical protein